MRALSATTLKLFQECPRCFWLHVNKRVERPRGPFPSLPSGIDRILKVYFDDYRDTKKLPPLIEGQFKGRLSDQALTIGFNDPETGARLWGKLDDCVIFDDERLAPLDHKTRASAPFGIGYSEKYYKLQMDVYTLLLERNNRKTTRTAYIVYYYPVEGVLHKGFPFKTTLHVIKTDPDAVYRLFQAASRCLKEDLPNPSNTCEYCRWIDLRIFSTQQNTQTVTGKRIAQSTSQSKVTFPAGSLSKVKKTMKKPAKVKQSAIQEDLFI